MIGINFNYLNEYKNDYLINRLKVISSNQFYSGVAYGIAAFPNSESH